MKLYACFKDYCSEALEILKKAPIEITVRETAARPSEEELAVLVKTFDIIIIGAKEKMTPKVYENANEMKILGTQSSGLDHIDKLFFEDKKMMVLNCPDANTASTAEHTFALILGLYKKIIQSHNATVALTGRKGLDGLSFDLCGKTLGVMGAGRIGRKVMEMSMAFDLNVLCNTLHPEKHRDLLSRNVRFVDPEYLFSNADIVSLHIPLCEDTKKIIDNDLIKLMKSNAMLVNAARADLIDIKCLEKALRSQKIFGAALDIDIGDVESIEMLKDIPDVVLTPHTAGLSVDSIARMGKEMAGRIVDAVLFSRHTND